jgi:hypothetical protein
MSLFGAQVKQFLPDRDYLSLALPTSDMDVLWVLTRDRGAVRRFGVLADVLTGPTPPGEELIRREAIVVDATGNGNHSEKAGLTLNIVNTILTALGGKAGLSLADTGASTVDYTYTDVRADTVDIVKLDGWLAQADLSHTSPRVGDMLFAEKIYVVVGALKASGIAVSLFDDTSQSVKADIPTIQNVVGGGISINKEEGHSNKVAFHGAQSLTVAAKVAQLKADERGFWVNERPLSGNSFQILEKSPAKPDYLHGDALYLY